MKVLLIATNRDRQLMGRMNAQPVPIGLAYVAGHLDASRHSIKVLDLMFSEDYLGDTEKTVREFQPDVVGISLRNLDNSSYMDTQWALPTTKEVIDRIRATSMATIVCGGPAFSLLPKECFRFLEPDLGIAGDGGENFAQLVDCLESGEPYLNLPGLVYREGANEVVCRTLAYSTFSSPPRLEELDMVRYERAGFGIGIVTKLDDNFSDAMDMGAEGHAWRVIRPIEDVVREVKEMKERFGLRKVFFIDSGFNVPLAHAKALCQSLIEADLNLHWNSYLAPVPRALDPEVVGLMKRAGCALVIMKGIQADGVGELDLETSLEPLRQACYLCQEAGLHYTISQSFGEPGETRETVGSKLSFLRGIKPALVNLRIGERVRPGTHVAQIALEEGLISDESDLIRPTFYVAESVKDWIVDHLKAEAAPNPRWNLV